MGDLFRRNVSGKVSQIPPAAQCSGEHSGRNCIYQPGLIYVWLIPRQLEINPKRLLVLNERHDRNVCASYEKNVAPPRRNSRPLRTRCPSWSFALDPSPQDFSGLTTWRIHLR